MVDRDFDKGVRQWYRDPEEHRIWAEQRVSEGVNRTETYFFEKYLSEPVRVLNVGCGGGREAIALAGMGHEVVAVDLMDSFIEAARRNADREGARVTFRSADVKDLPFPDGSFDRVVMIGQMIGQVPTRDGRHRALSECRRVLADEGLLLCSTNAIEHSWKYGFYFRVVNGIRRIYNPHGLEPGDAFVFRTGGRFRLFRNRRNRSIYHWYTRKEFLEDLNRTGWRAVESKRRWEVESAGPRGRRLLGAETFYIAEKE